MGQRPQPYLDENLAQIQQDVAGMHSIHDSLDDLGLDGNVASVLTLQADIIRRLCSYCAAVRMEANGDDEDVPE
jgi:hypothetical protein